MKSRKWETEVEGKDRLEVDKGSLELKNFARDINPGEIYFSEKIK
ncbi:hypothetical protein ASZ90_017121 [hydrocarbon metagenome]|uniref:Uncharacterized protein n=1 Tax=hydrocarbon metagenome TaxID=938273 RepID=A0A0W8E9Z9_9ZZZZ